MMRGDDHAPPGAIGAVSRPVCHLCGSAGTALYAGLPDRLFGAPGLWDFKICPNRECALIWLDPMPAEGEIGKAYATYYTHRSFPRPAEETGVERALLAVYLAVDTLVSRVTGLSALKRRAALMYLDGVPPGRLLDVGCGDGTLLGRMRGEGWAVEGVEVDPEAAEHARMKHGVAVHLGALETLQLRGDTFDAVVMSHVLEHVFDPLALLTECRRILKPGGRLVAVTPNAKSLGHRWFGPDWNALDPPRHLHLFSRRTLLECARRAGFANAEVWCTPANADGVIPESVFHRSRGGNTKTIGSKISRTSRSFFLKYRELRMARRDPDAGEEAVMSGLKE